MILFLLAVGLAAGIIAGLLGLGGGIIFTPVMFILFSEAGVENPTLWTIGSGLLCSGIAAAGSVVRQKAQNNIFLKESLFVGILGTIGVFIGKLIITAPFYSRTVFVIVFTVLLVFASVMMFLKGRDKRNDEEIEYQPLGFIGSFATGGLGGLIASLAGVGGGAIMVPTMNLIYKQPFRKTVSISSFAIVIITFFGAFQLAIQPGAIQGLTEYTIGYVDYGASLPLIIGGIAGGFLGALLNHKIDRKILQWSFSALALFMAIRLILSII